VSGASPRPVVLFDLWGTLCQLILSRADLGRAAQAPHVGLQELHHHGWHRDVAGLAALDHDAAHTPGAIEVVDTQRGDLLAPHAGVAQDEKDDHVARPPAARWSSTKAAIIVSRRALRRCHDHAICGRASP